MGLQTEISAAPQRRVRVLFTVRKGQQLNTVRCLGQGFDYKVAGYDPL